MADAGKGAPGKGATVEVRVETYNGHEIIYPRDERRHKIFIDGRPIRWGVTSGSYYLDVYAYDRGRTLDETVKRYLDHRDRIAGKARKGAR
jgi:hypothetical protein